ncbi:MerR family transcriptional regulator [Caulobacter sp. DWP3-1-3b2]|uniref:MerR family transcriptional regulator n=1 Tax=Caulobacter sp. DWP3-1-3b2 TaxID=2804643 RepID=UPI003CF7590C
MSIVSFPLARTSLPIGEASKRLGLTARAIRFYEEKGLLESGRDKQGRRSFDCFNLERLAYIASGRQGGLSIRQIADLLDLAPSASGSGREKVEELCRQRLMQLRQDARNVVAFMALRMPGGGSDPDSKLLDPVASSDRSSRRERTAPS